jgi:hypothetical protein
MCAFSNSYVRASVHKYKLYPLPFFITVWHTLWPASKCLFCLIDNTRLSPCSLRDTMWYLRLPGINSIFNKVIFIVHKRCVGVCIVLQNFLSKAKWCWFPLFHVEWKWIPYVMIYKELHDPVVSALDVQSRKLSNVGQSWEGWPKICCLELLHASEGTLNRWSRLHLQSLAPTNPHWARVGTSIGWWW